LSDIVKLVNLKIEGIEGIFITISMLHVNVYQVRVQNWTRTWSERIAREYANLSQRIEREPDLKELHVNTRISQRIAREPDLKELHVNML